jgi:hypothetical protein
MMAPKTEEELEKLK